MSTDPNPKSDAAADNTTEDGVIAAQHKDQTPTTVADKPAHVAQDASAPGNDLPDERPVEHGGQAGLEPTRYGDWEKKGRCTDF